VVARREEGEYSEYLTDEQRSHRVEGAARWLQDLCRGHLGAATGLPSVGLPPIYLAWRRCSSVVGAILVDPGHKDVLGNLTIEGELSALEANAEGR